MDYDFFREGLQEDVYKLDWSPLKWTDYEKQTYMNELFPRGLYVYDNNDKIIDLNDYKLLDFVNSK